jgi:hypothetical protein
VSVSCFGDKFGRDRIQRARLHGGLKGPRRSRLQTPFKSHRLDYRHDHDRVGDSHRAKTKAVDLNIAADFEGTGLGRTNARHDRLS